MAYDPNEIPPSLQQQIPAPEAVATPVDSVLVRDPKELLANDAKNRSIRTLLQGAAIDIAVAIAALVLASVDTITDRQGLIVFFTALGKTIVTTIAAYVMRQYLDRSGLPTPLPPSDPGEPDAPVVETD